MSLLSRRDALKALGALPIAASSAQTPSQSGKKVLRYAFEVAETGFDPAAINDLYSRIVTSHIFESPYGYDYLARPYEIRPATADGMPEVSADFRIWIVRLKRGIYFQRSEEHTSELQSLAYLVCRLLLEKKKTN